MSDEVPGLPNLVELERNRIAIVKGRATHNCHAHPLGGEPVKYRCGHYCYEPPCWRVTLAYRLRKALRRA